MNENNKKTRGAEDCWFPVFHVPHDGAAFPEELFRSACVPREVFAAYHEAMRDKDAGALIPRSCRTDETVCAFAISRLLCDVERFIGPEETMERYGMGYCYEKAFDGTVIKRVTEELRKNTRTYYDAHHERVNRLCGRHRRVLLIDLHSYTGGIVPKDQLRAGQTLPDLCLGVDEQYTPPALARRALGAFRGIGLTVAVNYPYSGCYVPETVMRGEAGCEFAGIMLEFRRSAYLDETGGLDGKKTDRIREALRRLLLAWGCAF
ncbi:MAG: N-formylglutamate amidohydrolase [Clostridia bacterium]|nr:N-formylglutamate amidohydrolase [Clostridia bacterium]